MIPKFTPTRKKSFKEKYYPKLPMKFKLWWAKQLMYMMKGLGPNIHDDFHLFLELGSWRKVNGASDKHLNNKTNKPEQYWNC